MLSTQDWIFTKYYIKWFFLIPNITQNKTTFIWIRLVFPDQVPQKHPESRGKTCHSALSSRICLPESLQNSSEDASHDHWLDYLYYRLAFCRLSWTHGTLAFFTVTVAVNLSIYTAWVTLLCKYKNFLYFKYIPKEIKILNKVTAWWVDKVAC